MIRRFILRRYFRRIGRLGGQSRARRQRAPILATTRLMRAEMGLPASEALS